MTVTTTPATREIRAHELSPGMTVIDGIDGPLVVTERYTDGAVAIGVRFAGVPEPTRYGVSALVEILAEPVTVTTPTKTEHPADGSDRWSVTGEHGRVVYDVLGNHLALIWADGDIDPVMDATLARVREYAQLNDDDAVFAVLADLYRTELAGGAR